MNQDDLILQRALDDELRPNERLELDQRLESDPRLRARLTELETMRDLRREARPRGGLGLDFADRVMAQCEIASDDAPDELPREPVAGGPRLRSQLETYILIAATLVIALGAALFLRGHEEPSSMQASPEVRQEVRRLYEKFEEQLRREKLDRELRAGGSETRVEDSKRTGR